MQVDTPKGPPPLVFELAFRDASFGGRASVLHHAADRDRYPLHTAAHRRHRYWLVAMIAAGVDDEALVVPGGIKRNDRIAYKSAVNYNGRYDQCKVGPQLPPPNPLSVWGYYCTRALLSSLVLGVSSKNTPRNPPFLLRPSSVLVAPSGRHSGSERGKYTCWGIWSCRARGVCPTGPMPTCDP